MDECKEMILEKVERLIRTDSRDEFAFLLRNHLESSGLSTPLLSSSELLKSICSHRAVGCAAALLEGETGLSVDLKVTLVDGLSPLHLAAQSLSYGLTKLFLRHGARTRLHFGLTDPARFPLGVALNALGQDKYVLDWTPKKSVFKLLYIFCLPQLNFAIGTGMYLPSRSFHTGRGLWFNSNTAGRQLVMRPSSVEFLPEAKICARLLLTAKRRIR